MVLIGTSELFKDNRIAQTRKASAFFKGTVHSWVNNSWETETKTTVFVIRL